MAWKWYRDRQTFERWKKMQRQGHYSYLAISVLIMLGSYAVVRFIHIGGFKLGWFSSPGSTTWADAFFYAVLPGFIAAQIHWSDMKRKFSLPANKDRTMI